ncbi:hypothetical protein [[Kitasatospora] papulosa]|uniref:hypothetical protein n=1 Tax=[Kitasatospora] papulosa TaxID=1464011 RepID=UPI0036EABFA5
MDLTIKLNVPDPPPREIVAAIAALIDRIGPGVTIERDTEWTVERAVQLLRDTNLRTTLLIEAAVEGGGFADGPAFREKNGENALRGPSQSITKAIKRGAEQGLWSAEIAHPLTPTTPDKGSWSKTGGYYLAKDLVPVFRAAIDDMRSRGVLGP